MMTDKRLQMVKSLRAIADFLEKNPDITALPDLHLDLASEIKIALQEALSELTLDRTAIRMMRPDVCVSFEAVVSEVALQTRASATDILSGGREQHVALARHVAMYLCRLMTDGTFPKIAQFFGRDHSTVVHANLRISQRITSEPAFARTIEKIRRAIQSSAAATAKAAA